MSNAGNETITEEMINTVKRLIGNRDEVNLEWLKVVTQFSITVLSRIVIQNLGFVILEGIIYSKEKAERKLKQKQEEAQSKVSIESFRKGPVSIDMLKLRENLWTIYLPRGQRLFGQERHQFCPIWSFLEQYEQSKIILRFDWIKRLNQAIDSQSYKQLTIIEAKNILNPMGEDYKGKAQAIFAKSNFGKSEEKERKNNWVMFLINSSEEGVKLEGLDMINVLKISTKFHSREKAYAILNQFLELVNFVISDPSLFEEVIIVR